MIILLICLIILPTPENRNLENSSPRDQQEHSAAELELKAKQDQIADLKEKISSSKNNRKLTGLWVLKIQVERLVSNSKVIPCNEDVEYYVWIRPDSKRVAGSMFGAKTSGEPCANYARIQGTVDGGQIEMEFHFTGSAQGASELASLSMKNGKLTGRLKSGKLKTGMKNFEGTVVGQRITGSIFGKAKKSDEI